MCENNDSKSRFQPQAGFAERFGTALSKPGAKRAAWLNAECDGNTALRARLETLLAAHEQPESELPTQAAAGCPTIKLELADVSDEAVGQSLENQIPIN